MAYRVRVIGQQTIAELGERHVPGDEFVWTGEPGRLEFLCRSVEDGGPGYLEIVSDAPESAASGDVGDLEAQWSVKTPPDIYLERWPKGPHAGLAARILAAYDEADAEAEADADIADDEADDEAEGADE